MKKKKIDFTPKTIDFAKKDQNIEEVVSVAYKDHVKYAYAEDLQDMLGISRTRAYEIIKQLKKELPDDGINDPVNRISREVLMAKLYGGVDEENVDGTMET